MGVPNTILTAQKKRFLYLSNWVMLFFMFVFWFADVMHGYRAITLLLLYMPVIFVTGLYFTKYAEKSWVLSQHYAGYVALLQIPHALSIIVNLTRLYFLGFRGGITETFFSIGLVIIPALNIFFMRFLKFEITPTINTGGLK